MGPYFGKLIAWNRDMHPARYYWSPSAQPWYFPGAGNGANVDDDVDGNWEDAGSDDDQLVWITNHNNVALIYKQRSLWRLVGDPATSDAQQMDASIGLVGPQAVCNAGEVDYFMGPEGIYQRSYDFKNKISGAIDPIFKGDAVQISNGEYLPPIDMEHIGLAVLEIVNDRLYVSYPEQGNSINTVTAICQLPTLSGVVSVELKESYSWARMKLNTGVGVTTAFTALKYEGAGNSLMGAVSEQVITGGIGSLAGGLYSLEQNQFSTDAGNSIHLAWQSRFSDQGLPDNYKWYTDVIVDFQTAVLGQTPSTLSVYLVIDNGTKILLGTISSAARTRFTFQLNSNDFGGGTNEGQRATNAAIRIEGDATSTCIVYGTYLMWYPEERLSTSFDSGFNDLGIPERAKQIDYLELYATAAGQPVTSIISSDLPGSLLTRRDGRNITFPNGRGSVRMRLPIIEGRNFRYTLGCTATFQLHKLRMRQRVVGEYIDGTIGEYYQSPEFSVAPGRVGELKDFLLDYDVSGPGGQFVLYADLPGNTLAVVRTMAIPFQTGRDVHVFPLEDVLDTLPAGQLFKVQLIPPPGGILRLHGRAVFRARIIGVYFDGSQGEIWETQPVDLLGGVGLYREITIVAQTGGAMLFQVLTELPNHDVQPVATIPVDSTVSTTGRRPLYSRLPGTTKGRLTKYRLSGPYVTRLFEVKVLARKLGVNGSDWEWISVPIEATPDSWDQIKMPVRETPEEFTWVEIPVDQIG
ncbi:MAG TPA: hypothetical protein VKS01_12410, partial [Bryobacteraceae bacterium]|nr:hypothetical protein [Bryobacteraceae bacterium]